MDCSGARAALWPPDRPRLVSGVVEAARLHLRGCVACQEYFAQEPSLLDLYDRARTRGAPHEVRARIVHALADEPLRGLPDSTPIRWRRQTRHLTLGIVAVGLAAVVIDTGTRRSAEAPDVFVEDYLRRAVGEDHIETDDSAEVTRFLQREIGIRIVPIRVAGLALVRAEICLLKGQRGAMIVYAGRTARIRHYLVPAAVTARAPALSGSRMATAEEMSVVTWATPDVEHALVGNVSADRLLEIAALGWSHP